MEQLRLDRFPFWQRLHHAVKRDARPTAMYVPWVLPKWLTNRGMVYYFIALLVVTLLFSVRSMPWYYMLSGAVSVLLFWAYGQHLSRRYSLRNVNSTVQFERRIFSMAFFLRLIWMLLIYVIFMETYDNPFGFDNYDAMTYHVMGKFIADMLDHEQYNLYSALSARFHFDISDMGYGTYVGVIYYLTNNSIIAVRLLKCLWSALTVVLVYRLAMRHFGPQIARITAIFCTLWPNFWYYCGVHLKEVEMVFLVVLFVEQADQMMRSRQFTVWKLIPLLLIVGALFTIRTVAALVAILALLVSVVMASSRVVSWGKRIIVGLVAVVLIGVTMGERIEREVTHMTQMVQSDSQQHNMEWRSRRKNGNVFAKYAGTAVFAPMIFTIPFPSMVNVTGQDVQQLLNGGNYIKNILSFFVLASLFIMFFSGSWRDHMLPLAFMLGYIMVLVMSGFPHSERFHQPVMPFEFMFASYGLSIVMSNKKYQQWFKVWCVVMLVAAIAWNWFKLAGRGLA